MGSVRLRAGCSLLISYRNISLDSSQNRRSPWQVTLKADPDFDKYLYFKYVHTMYRRVATKEVVLRGGQYQYFLHTSTMQEADYH